jgi:predicted nucleic acid-binding protein
VSTFVVDASVVIKWFVPEIHSDAARRLLEYGHEYLAPDLVFAETANAIWKKVRRGELSSDQGQRLVMDLGRVAVETVSCRALAADAHALAIGIGRTVYDAMYLTLAVRLETRMITADERLASSLAAIPLIATHIQTVQTFSG